MDLGEKNDSQSRHEEWIDYQEVDRDHPDDGFPLASGQKEHAQPGEELRNEAHHEELQKRGPHVVHRFETQEMPTDSDRRGDEDRRDAHHDARSAHHDPKDDHHDGGDEGRDESEHHPAHRQKNRPGVEDDSFRIDEGEAHDQHAQKTDDNTPHHFMPIPPVVQFERIEPDENTHREKEIDVDDEVNHLPLSFGRVVVEPDAVATRLLRRIERLVRMPDERGAIKDFIVHWGDSDRNGEPYRCALI